MTHNPFRSLFRRRPFAKDVASTPIGDRSLVIDHWRGCVRIRRGEAVIVIDREELRILAELTEDFQ